MTGHAEWAAAALGRTDAGDATVGVAGRGGLFRPGPQVILVVHWVKQAEANTSAPLGNGPPKGISVPALPRALLLIPFLMSYLPLRTGSAVTPLRSSYASDQGESWTTWKIRDTGEEKRCLDYGLHRPRLETQRPPQRGKNWPPRVPQTLG